MCKFSSFMISFLLVSLSFTIGGHAGTLPKILAISYHDVADKDPDQEKVGITTANFIEQVEWLAGNGYTAISAHDLVRANKGEIELPEKPVMMTFDDGYASYYTHVFPIMQAYNMPSIIAVVGKWLDVPVGRKVKYGNRLLPREDFITWAQVKELSETGLVEVASHTFAMQAGILANPQGNTQPTVVAYAYLKDEGRYETVAEHRERIGQDFAKNSDIIEERIGTRPHIMVWPYGEYSQEAVSIARDLGMDVAISLDSGYSDATEIDNIRRILVSGDMDIGSFAYFVQNADRKPPQRAVQVDMDYLYDPDPVQLDKNLGLLLDRIKNFGITTVYMQAFADADGDSVAEALYFPNRYLPMKADLFNRVSWQLRSRAGVKVYAWMPLIAYATENDEWLVTQADKNGGQSINPQWPKRLSPFHPEAVKLLEGVFEDLGRMNSVSGILFSDDGIMTDFEDASPAGMKAFSTHMGHPVDVAMIRADNALFEKWTDFKSQALIDLTDRQIEAAEIGSRKLDRARNLFARTIQQPESRNWFAQDLPSSIETYDYTALMAMPFLEDVDRDNWEEWMVRLIEKVKATPGGLEKTVFEIQMVDWRDPRTPLDADFIEEQINLLHHRGVKHIAYYPDDFIQNHPPAQLIERLLSVRGYPFRAR